MSESAEQAEPIQIDIAAALRMRDLIHTLISVVVENQGHAQSTSMLAVLAATGRLVLDNCKPHERQAGLLHASKYFAEMAKAHAPKKGRKVKHGG